MFLCSGAEPCEPNVFGGRCSADRERHSGLSGTSHRHQEGATEFFCHIRSTVAAHLWQELHSKDNLRDAKSPKYLNKYLFIPIITDVLMAETSLHTFSDFI